MYVSISVHTYSHGDSSNWDYLSGWANSLKFVQVTWKPLRRGQWPNAWLDPLPSSPLLSFKGFRLHLSRIAFFISRMMFPFSPGLMYNFYRISSQEHGFRFEARNTFIIVHRNLHELNRKEQKRPARNGFSCMCRSWESTTCSSRSSRIFVTALFPP